VTNRASVDEATRDRHRAFYNVEDSKRWGRHVVAVPIPQAVLERPGVTLEVGCGNGPARTSSAISAVVDISFPALRYLNHDRKIQGDAQSLPLADESVDTYISVATLEHVPDPDRALAEMDRVLRPGGVAFLAPAWNCRSWTARGVTVRRYGELSWPDRILKASLVLRGRLWWRAAAALPKRAWREIKALRGRPRQLDYRPLKPNLDEYLCSDSDAWASIDPHAAITFLRTRGYRVLSHASSGRRFFVRHDPVIAEKPR
jgi:SAM-dependent methyltransferase